MEALRKKRATVKSALTRFNNYLDSFTPLSDVEDLQSRLEKAIPLLDKFETIQEEIESLDEVDLDETVRTREDFEREKHLREEEEIKIFEDSYHKAIGKAKGFIKSRQSFVPSVGSVSRSVTESPALHSEAGPIGVSLPKLVLPTFDGTVSNWIKFRDTFRSLIHEHMGLSNIQKFHYLNSALIGDAARTIEALGVSEANYLLAWEGLKSRYEDPNTLIHHHVQALFEAPVLTRDSSHSELRQLLDNTNNNLLALRTLGKRTEFWDPLIIYLLTSKLNISMRREWGRTLANSTTEPTFKEFANFLERHIKFLQNSDLDKIKFNDIKINKATVKSVTTKPKQIRTYSTVTNKKSCIICNGAHPIYSCEVFKGMSTVTRLQKVRELHLCFNCLGDGHQNRDCTFGPCRKCGKKHNYLLHLESSGTNTSGSLQVQVTGAQSEGVQQVANSMQSNESMSSHSTAIKQTLTARVIQKGTKVTVLSTARIYIYDCHGQRHECRALLDSGSEPHIMTTALCNRLGLPKTRSNLALTGIEQGSLHVNHLATTKICSRITNFSATITCVILDKISSNIPSLHINTTDVQIPKDVELADPDYNCSGPVDLIIGASLFLRLLSVGQIFIKNTELILHKTVLGWIIAGNLCLNSPRKLICNLVKNQDLNNQLERFWKLEHCFLPVESTAKSKRDHSEQHFIDTTERDETGRFVVSIPFKDNASELGNSLAGAEKRFLAVERKLSKNLELKEQYTAFMEEYEALGHMSQISLSKYTDKTHFYLPHHAVIKEGSTTTKLRVVFDGSAKTSSGLSLNDVQYIGPTVQDDLFTILVRFRKHSIVLSADIAKMYRQIKVKAHDKAYQLILWRSDTNAPMKYFELNTVTYGTASAPFLATRCLRQLSDELEEENPVISQVIRHDFYVDDLLTGTDNIEEAMKVKNNLVNILSSAGFELRKWASNDSRLQTESKNTTKDVIPLLDKDPKTLGLFWDPVTDTLRYNVKYSEQNRITKRTITSTISQIFDPLGLVGPTVIKAKIILQKLMGNLPTARVLPARPFYNCGVDYAGPFLLKEGARARVSNKSYICIFICFVTKAVHIELARDLSTEAFLNCLKRFISRRGRCKNIYSDNGKNFVGARNELAKLIISDNGFESEVTEFLSNEQIEWHFIPPYAPHFGGLWESAVKSAKFHLKRVIGETRLTYEELYTIITQVEACLNSRPLSPLSNDPNDLSPLTPGHFLIGDSLMTFPQEHLHDVKTSRLHRYQHLQQMFQHFWNRWQREYLPQLQARHKWYKSVPNALKIGAMVLIREDNIPAMQWPLGRITECHHGKDGIIRVVSVRLPRGIVKGPVSRICVLPLEQTDNSEHCTKD